MSVLTFQISTLNHFLSSLTCPLWRGAMTFGSSEAKGRTAAAVWSVLVNAIQFPWVFRLIPFDCCDFEIRWGAFGGEGRVDVLNCSSSLLGSGAGVELKTMTRRVGWWALLGLVGALGWGVVVMGWLVFWLVAASA